MYLGILVQLHLYHQRESGFKGSAEPVYLGERECDWYVPPAKEHAEPMHLTLLVFF